MLIQECVKCGAVLFRDFGTLEGGMKCPECPLRQRIAELEKAIIAAFSSGRHHGHTEAVEQVRSHCNLYPGWNIHETLEPLLAELREAAYSAPAEGG